MKADRRIAERKNLDEGPQVKIDNLTALDHFAVIARFANLVDVSATGIMLHISREDLVPRSLRQSLSLDSLCGEHVKFHVTDMQLEIDGQVTRTKRINKTTFEVGIDFSDSAPEYWRECLVDLMPDPGEFDDVETH